MRAMTILVLMAVLTIGASAEARTRSAGLRGHKAHAPRAHRSRASSSTFKTVRLRRPG